MTLRSPIVILMVSLLAGLGGSVAVADTSCKDCHAEKATAPVLHPAVAMGCESCHRDVHPKNDPKKKSQLMEQGERLCFLCHDAARYKTGTRVHPPAADGSCLYCHDPHGSDASALLRPDMPALCVNCHNREALLDRYVHGPVMIGNCMACHEPHTADFPGLLKTALPALCQRCHRLSRFLGRSIHAPVRDGACLLCHKPHAADNRELLVTTGNGLCLQCHGAIARAPHAVSAGGGRGGHILQGDKDPRRRGRPFGCTSCHEPHRSDSRRLFRYSAEESAGLCTACHRK